MRCFSRSSVVTSGFASSGRRLIGSKKDISVIVVDDIPSVGSKGEIKQVRPGCARNFLFPKKMAVYDSPINRIKFEEFTSSLKLEDKKDEEKRKAAIARLETVTVRVKRAVIEEDAKGKKVLHAPVHVQDIVRALWRQHFIAVSDDRVTLGAAGISSLGRHDVNVIVGDGAKKTVAKLSLVVEPR